MATWSGEATDSPHDLIKPELRPGERLLWSSRMDHPSPTLLKQSPRPGFAWSLRFGGAAVVLLTLAAYSARLSADSLAAVLLVFGLIPAMFSVVVLCGSTVQMTLWRSEKRRLSGRVYALTDARAIIWDPASNSSVVAVHTFPRGTIRGESLRRMQFPDGSGDVLFGNGQAGPPGFLGVADVRRVEDLIRDFLLSPAYPAVADPAYSEP